MIFLLFSWFLENKIWFWIFSLFILLILLKSLILLILINEGNELSLFIIFILLFFIPEQLFVWKILKEFVLLFLIILLKLKGGKILISFILLIPLIWVESSIFEFISFSLIILDDEFLFSSFSLLLFISFLSIKFCSNKFELIISEFGISSSLSFSFYKLINIIKK